MKNNNYVTLEQLSSLLSESGYICLGHGTGRAGNDDSVVDMIFKEGLRTKDNSLYYTTIGLSTPTPEIIQNSEELGIEKPTIEKLENQFNNWPHLDSKKIIIARIPTKYINNLGNRSDLGGELFGAFMIEKPLLNNGVRNYLNPAFIIGCYDVDKKMVRLNDLFEKELSEKTLKEVKEKYKKTLEKTQARLEEFDNMFPFGKNSVNIKSESENTEFISDSEIANFKSNEDIDWDFYDEDIDWDFPSLEENGPKM